MDGKFEANPNKSKGNCAHFERFESQGGNMAAVFYNPETGHRFFLDREGLEDKIENLKKDSSFCEEEERAIREWPRNR